MQRQKIATSRRTRLICFAVLLGILTSVTIASAAMAQGGADEAQDPAAPEQPVEAGSSAQPAGPRPTPRMLQELFSARIEKPAVTDQRAAEEMPLENLDDEQAVAVTEAVFGSVLESTTEGLGELEDAEYLSPYAALVEGASGEPASILESTVPLFTEGPLPSPVDLTLEPEGGDLVPANPLVEVAMPERLEAGIELPGSGVSVGLAGAPEEATAIADGDNLATYANVAAQTDLSVAAAPAGFETLTTLRGPESPTAETFDLQLPPGGELQADDGGAFVQVGGERTLRIPAPTALDAAGKEVPVSLEVRGNSITVAAEPGPEAVYPILVDPSFFEESYDWHDYKATTGQGTWHPGNGTPSRFGLYTTNEALNIWAEKATYSPSDWAGWYYWVPRLAEEEKLGRQPESFILSMRIWHLSFWAGSGPESPFVSAGPYGASGWLQPPFDYGGGRSLLTNYETTWVNGSRGHRDKTIKDALGLGLSSVEVATTTANRDAELGAAAIQISDEDIPLARSPSTSPWMDQTASAPITVETEDKGLGVKYVGFEVPGQGVKTVIPGCTGGVESPCPRNWEATLPESQYNPATMPQGLDQVPITVEDPVENRLPAGTVSATVRVDHTAPTLALSGSLTEQATLGDKLDEYTLIYAATDGEEAAPQSGVVSTEVKVDGELVEPRYEPGCATESCSVSREWTLDASQFPYGKHVLKVTAKDGVGHETAKEVPFELLDVQTPPVAAYPFDEGTGMTAGDVSGAGHDGTLSAEGVEWAPGRYGTGLRFDGSKGCVTIPDSAALRLAEEFTLEAWVRPEGGLSGDPAIVKQASGFPAYGLGVGMTTSGLAEGQIGTEAGSHSDVASPSALEAGVWSHEALTFDGAKLRLYVNGTLAATKAVEKTNSAALGELKIGCSSSQHFNGRIDEIRIYNRALEAGEVATDMEAPIQTPKAGPVAAFSFDEGEGTTTADVTGDGHAGTLSAEGVSWAPGRYGDALKFDGSKGCVSIPDSSALRLREEFTLEAWVRPEGELLHLPAIYKQAEGFPAYALGVGLTTTGRAAGQIGTEAKGSSTVISPTALEAGVWSHEALTFDGANLRLYVNGTLAATKAVEKTNSAAFGELKIGCSSSQHFRGRIDEVRVYNRAISKSEIQLGITAGFPSASTEPATEIEANEAILHGTADANSGETDYYFQYGPTTTYGDVIEAEELGDGPESLEVEEAAIELAPETTYHYRLVADSVSGTAVGKDQSFTTAARTMSTAEEKELSEAEGASVLTAKASSAGPGELFGMMWSGSYHDMKAENAYEAISRSGAKYVRLFVEPGERAVDEEAFAEAAAHNLRVLPYFGSGPYPKSEHRERWLEYAEQLVKNYGPGSTYKYPIDAWEIWNEPNMPFPKKSAKEVEEEKKAEKEKEEKEEKSEPVERQVNPKGFAVFLKEMSERIKKAAGEHSKEIEILAPGLYGYRVAGCHPECHQTPNVFLSRMNEKLKELGNPGAYEAISLHPYVFKVGPPHHQEAPGGGDVVHQVALEKRAIRKVISLVHMSHPSKPIWVTELGFPVANPGGKGGVPPVNESVQKYLVQAAFSMIDNNRGRLDIAHAFYYNIQDKSEDGWEYHSGLLRLNGTARPAWSAYANLAGGQPTPH